MTKMENDYFIQYSSNEQDMGLNGQVGDNGGPVVDGSLAISVGNEHGAKGVELKQGGSTIFGIISILLNLTGVSMSRGNGGDREWTDLGPVRVAFYVGVQVVGKGDPSRHDFLGRLIGNQAEHVEDIRRMERTQNGEVGQHS